MPHFGEPQPTTYFGYWFRNTNFATTAYNSLNYSIASALEINVQSLTWRGRFVMMKVNIPQNTLDGTATVTLRVNGANTALTVTIPIGATGNFTSTNVVPVMEDDLANFLIVTAGTVGSIYWSPSLKFISP